MLFLFALLLSAAVSAQELLQTVEGRIERPDPRICRAPRFCRALLNGGQFAGIVREDGSFAIYDVLPGYYSLQIHGDAFIFPTLFVEVSPKGGVRIFRDDDRQKRGSLPYPISLEPFGHLKYFNVRESFDYFAILKNPIVLILLVTAGLGLVMPKLKEIAEAEQEKARLADQDQEQIENTSGRR